MSSSLSTLEPSVLLSIEDVSIEKQRFMKADVCVRVETAVHDSSVEELLTDERIEIEHFPTGRYVDTAPVIRQAGDVTIISLVEELIERRLVLKEETHLRRVQTQRTHEQSVTLREEKLTVERTNRTAPAGLDVVQTR